MSEFASRPYHGQAGKQTKAETKVERGREVGTERGMERVGRERDRERERSGGGGGQRQRDTDTDTATDTYRGCSSCSNKHITRTSLLAVIDMCYLSFCCDTIKANAGRFVQSLSIADNGERIQPLSS